MSEPVEWVDRQPFVVLQWLEDSLEDARAHALLSEDFRMSVESQGGRNPCVAEIITVTEEQMFWAGIEPKPGYRLYRVYGHAERLAVDVDADMARWDAAEDDVDERP